jgi:hypothetical protein
LFSLALFAAGCVRPNGGSGDSSSTVAADEGWRSLLRNGAGLEADWRGYKSDHIPAGWTLADGILTKQGESDDLVTRDEFGDFELRFEWKIEPRGNAGVFYRATEEYDKVYWSGPEYQLLDDAGHPDGHSRLTSAGADYGLYPSPAGVVRPAGEWNESRIVVSAAHVEHWMNGKKLLEYELGSPDWEAKVAASKFHDYPNYGRARRGRIAIQGDHNGTLQLREIRIREIR